VLGAGLCRSRSSSTGSKNDERGRLTPGAPREHLLRGCFWACQYGRREVVEFLLARGIDLAESHGNQTMLHGAALGGHLDIVRILIAHGAPIDVKDDHCQPEIQSLFGLDSR
jgi:hypothetical protein